MILISFVSRLSHCLPLLNNIPRSNIYHILRQTSNKLPSHTMPIVAEYAKSNRSSCKSCSTTIASKSLRVGLITKGPGGIDMTRWHHFDCFPIDSESIASVDEIKGLSDLQKDDQEAMAKLVERCGEHVDEKKEEIEHAKEKKVSSSSTATSKVVVEYAKSSRSSCKKCSQTIAAEEMRLGLVTNRGYDMTMWYHVGCFSTDSDVIESVEDIGGFSSLQNEDQDALKQLVIQSGKKMEEDDNNASGADEGLTEETNKRKHSQVVNEKEEEIEHPVSDETSGKKKIKETKKPLVSTKVIAEYAKSSRSSCKKCSQTIPGKELRLGLVTRDSRGYDMTKWHHVRCFSTESDPIDSVEDIGGFSSLQNVDQDALKELVKQFKKNTVNMDESGTDKGETSKITDSQINITEAEISLSASDIKDKYKDVSLLPKWKAFETVIFLERDDGLNDSEKIAAFDFDGCLANTNVKIVGADKWSLMYPCIPEKLQSLYSQGYKLVIFTNESNIDRWKNKRKDAVDSKVGRLNSFIKRVEVPIQVFIACGVASSGGKDDLYRKPKAGMWQLMKKHFNSGIRIDMDKSFYVGDAAGRKGDHSDADIKFAQASGLKFYTPEEYFL